LKIGIGRIHIIKEYPK
jgi:hypothetical protein